MISETAKLTGMIFIILIGAEVYGAFLALSRTPQALAGWITGAGTLADDRAACHHRGLFRARLRDGRHPDDPADRARVCRSSPGLDFGMGPEATAVWFGILVVIVVEVGLITPPVGINAYVINSMAKDIPLSETFKGILPVLPVGPGAHRDHHLRCRPRRRGSRAWHDFIF